MKFHILIFGCQMNYSDSARIKAVLQNCGFSYTEKINEADIVIFDTCSVKQKAEDKITGKLKEIGKHQKVRITGCMIQHNLRQGKINNEKGKFKIGNFMGSLKTKTPQIIGFTTNEINKHQHKSSEIISTNHLKSSAQIIGNHLGSSSDIVGINHAFNPVFHNLIQKRKNIELFFRIDDVGFLPLILPKIGYKIKYDTEIINEYEKIIPQGTTSMNKHKSTAYIPISTGCNQFCSYCIVPYARGLEKNFPVQDIVNEAKIHIKNGAKEIVLIGQIVNKHPDFVQIIKEVLKIKGLQWLRYTSPYPTFYSPELLALHSKEPKLCPHIHMPLQSGSDDILKKMYRGYTSSQFKEFVDNIRKLSRDISITTDIIVGFPGETEKDFQKTLDMVKYARFDMIYMGIYSTRPGTIAERKYPDDIPYKVKHARRSKLNELLKKISLENNQKEIGSIKTVLINNIVGNHLYSSSDIVSSPSSDIMEGYTDNMKQIIIKQNNETMKQGDIVTVKITDGKSFKLYGEIAIQKTKD